jgi:hypothetical protein
VSGLIPNEFLQGYIDLEEKLVKALADLCLIFVSLSFSTLLHVIFVNRIFDTLSTYSYITNELQTTISYADAMYLKPLFEPDYQKTESWETMINIVKLPEDMRRKAVLDTAKKLLDANQKRIEAEKKAAAKLIADKKAAEKKAKEKAAPKPEKKTTKKKK